MNTVVERFALASILLFVSIPAIQAQSHTAQFHADANIVLINATVLDRHERPVRGLNRDAFRVFEGKSEQTITYFGEEEVPLSLMIVLDISGSMDGKISGARRALDAVLRDSNDADEFSLIAFSDRPRVAIPWTAAPGEIENSVLQDRAQGPTSMLDAIDLGLREIHMAKNPRRALLILSDGGDNYSRYTERHLNRLLDEAGVQMYTIDMPDTAVLRERSPEVIAGPDLLSRLCQRAGGRYYQVENEKQLASVADQIGKELRSQYVLGFAPPDGIDDGKFHRVRLQVSHPQGTPKLSVFWRRGYRAPSE
jgi:Ca-activated chloride channel family protein